MRNCAAKVAQQLQDIFSASFISQGILVTSAKRCQDKSVNIKKSHFLIFCGSSLALEKGGEEKLQDRQDNDPSGNDLVARFRVRFSLEEIRNSERFADSGKTAVQFISAGAAKSTVLIGRC
ncbi:hypothetical protein K0M31_020333 [Melipona bicolor]|uniref:Uncharacterized protein n=1 Tax=Melipona bicolor TaxID=60889 RepID=A0AA40G1F5_9HYME|nr:hypothetical protein K0M31_020333 [Melipona bicolor]